MCLHFFAYDYHPHYRFVLAANRDEYYQRPTEKAHFWASHPWVLAGRDLDMQGTWLGITRSGRFAAITNYRDPSLHKENAKSRGLLVSNYLCSNQSPEKYMEEVVNQRMLYNPFNILVGDTSVLLYFNQLSEKFLTLKPGIYGLSNHYLDTPWPKVQKSKQALANYLKDREVIEPQDLFVFLEDTEPAQDHELPDTGIGQKAEKFLSSVFIKGNNYGTQSSTVLLIDRHNHVIFKEKSYHLDQKSYVEVNYEFDIIEQ